LANKVCNPFENKVSPPQAAGYFRVDPSIRLRRKRRRIYPERLNKNENPNMSRSTPTIHNNTLFVFKEGRTAEIAIGSSQWFEWLNQPTSTIFSFQSAGGSYTARKEIAGNHRGSWYWKAYRKHRGTLYRAYLGKPEDLTLARLEEIARTLANRINGQAEINKISSKEVSPAQIKLKNYDRITLLLETKLQPPRLPAQLVERSELLALLDHAPNYKLTLLQAPAGFGKTTLVTQWLAHRQSQALISHTDTPPRAWVSLDSGDNDPVRFWTSLIKAYQGFQAELGQAALTQLSQTPQLSFTPAPFETVLTFLLNDLARLGQSGALILEDYHCIEHARIHETLAFFIEHLPASIYVIILTRSAPPMPLVRWRAKGNLLEIQSSQLRFSAEETASFVRQVMAQTLSKESIRVLHSYLEGWAAGLRLLALSLQSQMAPQAVENALVQLNTTSSASRTQRPIQEYFLSEVLAAQPEPLQLFLLQTSILSRLNGSLCEAVTGQQDSAAWLELAFRSGFFLEEMDSTTPQVPALAQPWYRYHALFAETMKAEAAGRLGELELRHLSARASHWYEAHAMPVEATEAALTAREFERVAYLIEKLNDKSYFAEYHTMRRWLEQVPEHLLTGHPALCFLYAQARLFSQDNDLEGSMWRIEPVEELLQMAEEGWRQQGNLPQVGIIYAFRATFTVIHGFIGPAVQYAHQALQLLPVTSEEAPDQRPAEWIEWRCGCLFALGLEAVQMGAFDKAYRHLFEAYTLSLKNTDLVFTNVSRRLLAGVCFELGELHQAASYYQQTLTGTLEHNNEGEDFNYAFAMAGLARLSYEWNELEKAEQQARAVSEFRYMGHFPHWEEEMRLQVEFLRLQVLYARGELAEMRRLLATLLVRVQASANLLPIFPDVRIWQAHLQIRDSDLSGAERTLNFQTQAEKELSPLQRQTYQLLQARLHLARGEPEEALLLLEKLLEVAQQGQHRVRALEIQLLMALAYAALKRGPEARQQLYQVLSLAHREGFIRLFLDEGEPLATLLRALLPSLTEKPLRTYAQNLLHAFNTSLPIADPAHRNGTASYLFEPLSAQEERVLGLLVAGQSNPEIARTLTISINTVKGHVKNLYRKLDVANRVQAAEVARRYRLV
jgi:LuxR family maltose regulon positive regulatory protein